MIRVVTGENRTLVILPSGLLVLKFLQILISVGNLKKKKQTNQKFLKQVFCELILPFTGLSENQIKSGTLLSGRGTYKTSKQELFNI